MAENEQKVVDLFHPAVPRTPHIPTFPCEVCGKSVTERESVVYRIVMPHLGEGMPAIACPAGHHYGCSDEHAEALMHRCYEEHLKPTIIQLRKDLAASQRPTEDEFGEDIVYPEDQQQ